MEGVTTTTKAVPPPMDPNTSEATQPQLDLARKQGDAYGEINGMRFTEVVEATFDKVKVKRGEKSP